MANPKNDMIVIGPPSVRVIEVKHWSAGWVDLLADLVEYECDKLTNKAKQSGTALRRIVSNIGRVDGVMSLTQPTSKLKKLVGRQTRGVAFHTLSQWKDVIGFERTHVLSPEQE